MDNMEELRKEVFEDQLAADLEARRAQVRAAVPMIKWALERLLAFAEIFDDVTTLEGIDPENPKSVAWALETMDKLISLHTDERPLANIEKFEQAHAESVQVGLDNVVCNTINALRVVVGHDRFMQALMELVSPAMVIHDAIAEVRRRHEGGDEL